VHHHNEHISQKIFALNQFLHEKYLDGKFQIVKFVGHENHKL